MPRISKLFFSLLLVICICISAGCGSSAVIPPDGPGSPGAGAGIKPRWSDIPYAARSPAEKLDIYLPGEGQGPFPVIVSIHGGAFRYGDKADGDLLPVLEGLNRGYAVVSVNYRLSDEAKFHCQVDDAKAAIRFIKANSGRYNLNPERIAVWGGSAGGYLAVAVGITADVPELDDPSLGNPDQSSRVQAVVDWCGPINFATMKDQLRQNRFTDEAHISTDWAEADLFGRPIKEVPDLVRMSDLSFYCTPDDPPIFIQHGARDPVVPPQQSEDFAARLRSSPGSKPVTIQLFQHEGHLGNSFSSPENLKKVFDFLDSQMKGK